MSNDDGDTFDYEQHLHEPVAEPKRKFKIESDPYYQSLLGPLKHRYDEDLTALRANYAMEHQAVINEVLSQRERERAHDDMLRRNAAIREENLRQALLANPGSSVSYGPQVI